MITIKYARIKSMISAVVLLSLGHICVAAAAAPAENAGEKHVLTLSISAPAPLANLKRGDKANPVYLKISTAANAAPSFSADIFPGQVQPIIYKLQSAGANGAQVQIVNQKENPAQPLSFSYIFSAARLQCLLQKNSSVQIFYDINTQLLDVQGIPADC